MAKPSQYPTWSTSGPITTPSSGKQAAGFTPSERGAAQYFNFLFNLLGSWIAWFDSDKELGLHPFAGVPVSGCAYDFVNYCITSTGAAEADFPLPLRAGDTIKSVTVQLYGATGHAVLNVGKISSAGVQSFLGFGTTTGSLSASWAVYTHTPPATALGAGESFVFVVDPSATGTRIGNVCVTYGPA